MNSLGITENQAKAKVIRLKKELSKCNLFFYVTILMPIIATLLFAFGVVKGKQVIRFEHAVGRVITPTSTGTGFRISPTKILTAWHVISDRPPEEEFVVVFGMFSPPKEVPVRLLYAPGQEIASFDDAQYDYAVLEILDPEAIPEVPELTLGISEAVEQRQEVYAVGYPEGNNENRTTDGIISATAFSTEGQSYDFLFDVNVDVDRGNSGGPLLIQETEEVVGILVMVNTGTHAKYNLALKIDEVSSLLGNIDLLQ